MITAAADAWGTICSLLQAVMYAACNMMRIVRSESAILALGCRLQLYCAKANRQIIYRCATRTQMLPCRSFIAIVLDTRDLLIIKMPVETRVRVPLYSRLSGTWPLQDLVNDDDTVTYGRVRYWYAVNLSKHRDCSVTQGRQA